MFPRRVLLPLRQARCCPRPQYHRCYATFRVGPRLEDPAEIEALLENPATSIHDFLPPKSDTPSSAEETELTSATLHHLLRLSALPPPADKAAEDALLKTLREHLHFVRSIQSVNTTGVEPLVRIEGPEGSKVEKVIEFEDIMGAEESLDAEGVDEMGWRKEGWKVKELVQGDKPGAQVEGRPKSKGMVGGYYVVEETEEGGAH